MPTTYTHYKFGDTCTGLLPEDIARAVSGNRDIYNFGVHGPDIFFYYHPLSNNEVRLKGPMMHLRSGATFFEVCRDVFIEHESASDEERDKMLAYIFGFLSHFVLDSTCHGYVERKKEVSGISHNKIESEYDGHLMRMDGISNPAGFDRSELLVPRPEDALVIARFFGIDSDTMLAVMKSQHNVIKFFTSSSGMKHALIKAVLSVIKLNGDYPDIFVSASEDPRCRDSNLRLDKLSALAAARYRNLAVNLKRYLYGSEELDEYFQRDFEAPSDYKAIPVFSYEDEVSYRLPDWL